MVFSFKCTSKKRRRCRTNPASFVAKIQISEQRTKGKFIFLCYFLNTPLTQQRWKDVIPSSVVAIIGPRFLHALRLVEMTKRAFEMTASWEMTTDETASILYAQCLFFFNWPFVCQPDIDRVKEMIFLLLPLIIESF